ncbi:type II toxin-antitoxin system RelE/ParE family toxin [Kordia jejudonensis]|uniref:type II toxin-antitoxin system RelE/ParE family toxin n=1 Tax=Kordia jejudonensis TaxID=1348245 RepID=UPI000629B621|nr:type II toxin-antitoxin system RelE/ParE family toxin [Kordia jejudonensis]
MAKKKIIWSSRAKEELKEALDFYMKRNGSSDYSFKILLEVEDITHTLSKSHFIGRLTSNKITRVIPMDVYLIFYEINNETIEIVSFWDNRQDTKKSP